MSVLYLLSLDRTAGLVLWAAAVQVGAFYMQRPYHEALTEWGTEPLPAKWLARFAAILGALAFASAAYVLYRVGWMAAVVALLIMFAAPVVVSTLDVWWLRSPARATAIGATPLTLAAFALLAGALARL